MDLCQWLYDVMFCCWQPLDVELHDAQSHTYGLKAQVSVNRGVLPGFVTGIHKDSVHRWNLWFPSAGVFAEVLTGKATGTQITFPHWYLLGFYWQAGSLMMMMMVVMMMMMLVLAGWERGVRRPRRCRGVCEYSVGHESADVHRRWDTEPVSCSRRRLTSRKYWVPR